MRFAYLILAHKNADQVIRLYWRLRHPSVVFIFHFSKNCNPHFYKQVMRVLKDQTDCFFAERSNVNWGGWGMVQGALNCIQRLSMINYQYDAAFLLSGQDYPLKTHAEMAAFLSLHPGKNFMEYTHYDQMTPDEQARYDRIHYWPTSYRHFVHPSDSKNPLTRLLHRLIVQALPGKTACPAGIIPYKGSFWWVLTPEAIHYLIAQQQTPAGQQLKAFFRYVNHPSEGYFQTVLLNSALRSTIVNEDLRFVKWDHYGGHPDPLLTEDLEPMMVSGKFFARKFDQDNNAELMAELDKRLG